MRVGAFDGGIIRIDHRFRLVDLSLLLVEILLGLEILQRQFLKPREILLRGDEVGLILRALGLGLIECGLEQARIDLGERIALRDALSFREQDFLEFAVDLRVQGDRARRQDGPETAGEDRQCLTIEGRNFDLNAGRPYGGLRGARRALGEKDQQRGGGNCQHGSHGHTFPAAEELLRLNHGSVPESAPFVAAMNKRSDSVFPASITMLRRIKFRRELADG